MIPDTLGDRDAVGRKPRASGDDPNAAIVKENTQE